MSNNNNAFQLPPIYYQTKHAIMKNEGKVHNGPILSLYFSNDGTKLATASSDHSMRVFKLPFEKFKGEGNSFLGHSNNVTFVRWSSDDKLLVHLFLILINHYS